MSDNVGDIDDLDIPAFLKLTAEQRRAAWARQPAKPIPAFSREITDTERAYRASIEAQKAERRAADELRFRAMRAKAAAEKAERHAVKQAVQEERDRTRRAR
jgi:hypothetical protein